MSRLSHHLENKVWKLCSNSVTRVYGLSCARIRNRQIQEYSTKIREAQKPGKIKHVALDRVISEIKLLQGLGGASLLQSTLLFRAPRYPARKREQLANQPHRLPAPHAAARDEPTTEETNRGDKQPQSKTKNNEDKTVFCIYNMH